MGNEKTTFTPKDGGKHRFLILKENYREVEKRINEVMDKIEKSKDVAESVA